MKRNETPQHMTYDEREAVKELGCHGSERAVRLLLVLITHWLQEPEPVGFMAYAGQWIGAQRCLADMPAVNELAMWRFHVLRDFR